MADRQLGYDHGISATRLLNDTIGGCLDRAASRWPDREAVVVREQNVRMTFATLQQEADRIAAGLIALGLVPGGALLIGTLARFSDLRLVFIVAGIICTIVGVWTFTAHPKLRAS